MKHKTSISFDEETIIGTKELLRLGLFRNKFHIVEYSIKKLINKVKNA